MIQLRVLLLSLALPFQVVAPAFAQGPPPAAAPAPAPAPAAPAPQVQRNPQPGLSGPSMVQDVCRPVPLGARIPLTFTPPPEWREKVVRMYAAIRQDGSVEDVKLVGASGSASLDAAVMAHVRNTWHWAPLICGRQSSNERIAFSIPRLRCKPLVGWMPAMPLALAQRSRSVNASVTLSVGQDGRMLESRLGDSSGDAALDAAVLAHVRQTWRFYALEDGCGTVEQRFFIRFPEDDCIPKPVMESRTLPAAPRQGMPRSLELQIGVDPDGKVLFTNIVHGSGDAALDAAAAAHVKQTWRWNKLTCGRKQVFDRGEALPVVDSVVLNFP